MALIVATVFLFGVILGSFYNVVSIRTLSKEGLSYPPSHCVKCGHNLSFLDLFPIVSWLFLRGKCRYCKEKISPVYPTIEFLTGLSYALIVYQNGLNFETVIQLVFITFMILATASDMREMIVPDRFVVIGLIVVLALRVVSGEMLVHYLVSALIAFGVLFFILILSKGRMGGADVKLYALIGLAIGWANAMESLFYASIAALIFYIAIALINKGKFDRKKEIPFVPFITIGVLCTYFLNFFIV